jgi:hypothetical protein
MVKMHIDGGFHQVERTELPEETFEIQLDAQDLEAGKQKIRVLFEEWLQKNISSLPGSERKVILQVRVDGEIVEIIQPLAESSKETERLIDKIRYAAAAAVKPFNQRRIYALKPRLRSVLAFLVEQGQRAEKFWTIEEIAEATGYEVKGTRVTLYEVKKYLEGLEKYWKMEGEPKKGWKVVTKKEYAPKMPHNGLEIMFWQKLIQGNEES